MESMEMVRFLSRLRPPVRVPSSRPAYSFWQRSPIQSRRTSDIRSAAVVNCPGALVRSAPRRPLRNLGAPPGRKRVNLEETKDANPPWPANPAGLGKYPCPALVAPAPLGDSSFPAQA